MPVDPTSFGPKADRQCEADARTGVRRYRQTFQLVTDDPADGADVLLDYPQLPQDGDALAAFPAAVVISRRPRQPSPEHWTFWEVDVEWSSEKQTGQGDINPLDRAVKVRWSTETFQEYASDCDVFGENGNLLETGLPMQSSAYELYDVTNPQCQRDDSRLVASCSGNVPFVPLALADYMDAVNSDFFMLDGYPVAPLQAKFSGLTISEKKTEAGIQYRELSFQIHLETKKYWGWREEIADAGFKELLPLAIGNVWLNIYDGQAQSISKPAFLDGTGAQNDPGDPPFFYVWRKYRELPFAPLGIPT